MSDKKYTWETDRNAEWWRNDSFDTVDECVKDYLENYADDKPNESIFVGETSSYQIDVDGSRVIEHLEECAYDDCGEVAENWNPSCGRKPEDWCELDKQLTEVVANWLKKHNEMPSFYNIVNIREVAVR